MMSQAVAHRRVDMVSKAVVLACRYDESGCSTTGVSMMSQAVALACRYGESGCSVGVPL